MTVESTGETKGGGLPELKQGRAVGEHLRAAAVAAVVERGWTAAAAARHFGLGAVSVRNWVKRFRERGHVRPDRQGGYRPSLIERERERIFRILEERPAISGRALRDALAAEGVVFNASTVQRFLQRHGLERNSRLARTGGSGGDTRRPASPVGLLSVMPERLLFVIPGLVPGISLKRLCRAAVWIPGTSPGMTGRGAVQRERGWSRGRPGPHNVGIVDYRE